MNPHKLKLLLIFSLLAPFLISAQEKFQLSPCEVYKIDFQNENTDLLDSYISNDTIANKSKTLAELLSVRALLTINQNYRHKSISSSFKDSIFQSARKDMNLSIKTLDEPELKIEFKHRRYQLFEFMKNNYPEYSSDLKALEDIGFKPDKAGFSFSLVTKYDGQFWMGGALSIPTIWQKKNQLKNGHGEIFFRSRDIIASALNFGIVKNLENDWLEWSTSLFKVEAPIYLDILRVGQIRTSESNHFFYRPEVGFGKSLFTLTYGYNVFFKKGVPEEVARHVVNFRMRYVI